MVLPELESRGTKGRVFIYCRVSSHDQAATNTSLPLQSKMCLDRADELGLPVFRDRGNSNLPGVWHDSAVSAWKVPLQDRPGFRAMWSKMQRNDTIIMLSLDRGWRNVQNFCECWQEFSMYGVKVDFVTSGMTFGGDHDSPMSRFILTGQANIAELKSELISARVRESWAERKARSKNLEGSVQACESAAEGGAIRDRTVRPIAYSESESGWGEAYQAMKSRVEKRKPGRVFGYCRVSTDTQNLRSQEFSVEKARKQFAESTGLPLGSMFTDPGISAYRFPWKERKAGSLLWSELKCGDHVFIQCADRAFRSIIDMSISMQELEDRGVTLHFIRDGIRTDKQGGLRLLQALSLAAQWERDDMSTRISFSLENNRQKYGIWQGPQSARWLRDLPNTHVLGSKIPVRIPDDDDIQRMMLITEIVRNKGKQSWGAIVREVESECAARYGRRPVPVHGASLAVYRRQCTPDQRLALKRMIARKTLSWTPATKFQGFKKNSEIHPEISQRWLRDWEEKVWGQLVQFVAVKPEMFGDIREQILEMA